LNCRIFCTEVAATSVENALSGALRFIAKKETSDPVSEGTTVDAMKNAAASLSEGARRAASLSCAFRARRDPQSTAFFITPGHDMITFRRYPEHGVGHNTPAVPTSPL
jgi:hypothetical protein